MTNGEYYHKTIKNRHKRGKDRFVSWQGNIIVKYPNDICNYQEIIFENKPDVIVETGTRHGGSALFFANMLDLLGKGKVITIDKFPQKDPLPEHKRITYLTGGSTSDEVLKKVKKLTKGKSVMVSLDSDHSRRHVKRELERYGEIVTKGQFMVVEDTNYTEIGGSGGPDEAVDWYLKRTNKFEVVPMEDKWIYSCNPGGYLRRMK